MQEACLSSWDRKLCLGLAQPGGQQDGVGFGLMLPSSLLLVPVDCVVTAPWTFLCLPEPWALHSEPGTPLHLLPCRGGVVGNTASSGGQQSPLPGCQALTESSDRGGRAEVTGAACRRGCCQASGCLPILRMSLLLFCRYP